MKHILVTGGAGYIGSHTCLELLKNNYKVTVFDSLINSKYQSLERVRKLAAVKNLNLLKFKKGDIKNKQDLENLFRESIDQNQPFDSVIHFAALKAVYESKINPIEYWNVNVLGTLNLVETMLNYKCFNIVFSSSATIYGIKENGYFDESSLVAPINPYGQTKAAAEKLLQDIYQSSPNLWRISLLRYFNPIGAHPSGEIGESPLGVPNNLLPFITQVANGRIDQLNIFGKDWPTKDGTGVRDYIHVMDLADAHLLAMQHLIANDPKILILNLGTGNGTSVLDLLKTFERVNNIKIPYLIKERRQGDVSRAVANNKKAIEVLNWSPKRKLEDACRDAWAWQKKNPMGF
tara:strand:- start:319 stop:1362 length:1044 start_codon:yes stop_codon:yes gene_type:complete